MLFLLIVIAGTKKKMETSAAVQVSDNDPKLCKVQLGFARKEGILNVNAKLDWPLLPYKTSVTLLMWN